MLAAKTTRLTVTVNWNNTEIIYSKYLGIFTASIMLNTTVTSIVTHVR